MEKLQIIRLPKKYADIVQILSLEDKGRLLDAILYYETKEIKLEGTTKTLFDLIKVDLDNLHRKASAGSKGGRPKKPKVTESIKPKVTKKGNLEKGKEEKGKEDKKNIEKDFLFSYLLKNGKTEFKESDDFIKTWLGFLSMRKKKGTQYIPTDLAKELSLGKLIKFDLLTAITMLESSIENNWTGLFELKGVKSTKSVEL